MLKSQANPGQRKEIYWFRDQQGLEVDFLAPQANAQFWAIEVKASKTVQSSMAGPLVKLFRAAGNRALRRVLVHRKAQMQTEFKALAPGVTALTMEQFIAAIHAQKAQI